MRQHARNFTLLFLILPLLAGCGRSPEQTRAPEIPRANETARTAPNSTATAPLPSDAGPALLDASGKGDIATVRALLDKGANVNYRDPEGRSALTEAAYNGHTDTVKLLLERGGDASAKKMDGASVLGLASSRGHKEIAELLKKAGAKE